MSRLLSFLCLTLCCVHLSFAIEPTKRDVSYAKVGDRTLTLDLYQPESAEASVAPTIVWVHGGAWRAGSKDDVPVTHWVKRGYAIASVDYRLSTEAQFPAAIHDIKAAIRYLRANAKALSLDSHRFVIAGSSAGGHLATLAGVSSGVEQLEGTLGDHTTTPSDVQAIVSFYGASNLETILSQSTEHGLSIRIPALQLFLEGLPTENPDRARLASPVSHVDSNDPPLWLIHGDADPQMPFEQSKELNASYKVAGLFSDFSTVSGGKHGGPEFFTAARLEAIADGLEQKLTTPASTEPIRMLFAGSSSTYWNDMPDGIARLVSGQGGLIAGRPVTAEIVGRSGSDIRVYLDPKCDYQYGVKKGQSFLDKVRDENFDYVVLMVVCRFITGDGVQNPDGQAHIDAINQYCRAIRQSGAEPIIYEMGWGKGEREAKGRRRIMELAKQNKIKHFAPCSSAWARVYEERPDLALQHPQDNSHPGDAGHLLNMACFYAALTHSSPEGKLPCDFHVWPHLNKEQKEAKKNELEAAFAAFEPNTYQERLPEWMQRNAGAGYRGQVRDADARYLEKTAWEVWQATQRELARAWHP